MHKRRPLGEVNSLPLQGLVPIGHWRYWRGVQEPSAFPRRYSVPPNLVLLYFQIRQEGQTSKIRPRKSDFYRAVCMWKGRFRHPCQRLAFQAAPVEAG